MNSKSAIEIDLNEIVGQLKELPVSELLDYRINHNAYLFDLLNNEYTVQHLIDSLRHTFADNKIIAAGWELSNYDYATDIAPKLES